ncbi:diaminopropionate ammonia-lyase [Polycladidibacter hongkongensis]|uniref:diaminopropionate ammonia-lyase n=1 Tax=Polycladidibacter hongkongensis TaxID=1647556 RepID=UPI00082D9926|nr:diaminopropionate ammonia-lyase [Pseudovibrio hongkongensis]
MLKSCQNRWYSGQGSALFNAEMAQSALAFHRKIEGYAQTPLVSLEVLAKKLGVKKVLVKDESYRFGLNAFKVLGGSFALGCLLAKKLGVPLSEIDLKTVASKLPEPMVFTTATAGNHGTGVAWAAREMGQKAVVYMPKGSPQASVKRVRGLGAECIVTDVNYDDTVRIANETAQANGWDLVQDTAWEGYEEIPTWISQGYMTMAAETVQQIADADLPKPTHVILQAGVGAMAGGVLGYLVDALGVGTFKTLIAEPRAAECIYRSGTSDEGKMTVVEGDISSIMAGLACGEPNPVTWPTLRDNSDWFFSVEDKVAATGMRMLGCPLRGDVQVISGESGAIGAGLLYLLQSDEAYAKVAKDVGLNAGSVVLIFSTEGDTSGARYQQIVWEGLHAL